MGPTTGSSGFANGGMLDNATSMTVALEVRVRERMRMVRVRVRINAGIVVEDSDEAVVAVKMREQKVWCASCGYAYPLALRESYRAVYGALSCDQMPNTRSLRKTVFKLHCPLS